MKMTTRDMIALAYKYAGANSNARFCAADAESAIEHGDYLAAREWALRSLKHSVGIFSPVYHKAVGQ